MPIDVKSYLASMKSISSQTTSNIKSGTANQSDLKLQALLAQLIEALSYAKSMDFRQKTLNATAIGTEDKTAREILEQMKSQEKLVKQLADGQALSKEQGKKLTEAIDKFYEMAGTAEINYKKFAENMEKFAMQDLPEAVKTRIVNDSRDAHMIGKEQLDKENPAMRILKKIKNYLEDTAETTKQFRKKLFVTLDQFKEGLFDAFDKLGDDIASGDIISKLLKNLAGLGALGLVLQGFTKEGMFGIPMLIKQFKNLQALAKGGKLVETVGDMFKGIRMIFKQFKFLPKLVEKFGLGKGLGAAAKGIGKGIAKGMGKNALKKIPVLGALLSVWFAWERWKQKDYTGAFIEIASGVASIFPGIGTLVSIGLDLINLGRDTGFFKSIKDKAMENSLVKQLSEDALLMMPVVGPIIGLNKIFKLWNAGDKAGALKLAPKVLSSLLPGGVAIFDALQYLFELKWDKNKSEGDSSSSGGGSGSKGLGGRGSGDSNGSSAQATGNIFANNAINIANSMGGKKSTHKCALGVDRAIEKTYKTRLYGDAWQMTERLKTSKFGKSHFIYKGKAGKDTFGKNELPAGTILGWSRYPGNKYGHIEIADGRGNLISDFIRSSSGPLGTGYRKHNIKPEIFVPKGSRIATAIANEVTSDANPGTFTDTANSIKTYDDTMSSYTAYSDSLQNQINDSSGIKTYDDAISAYMEYMDKIQNQINEIPNAQTNSNGSWAKRADLNSMSSKPAAVAQAAPTIQSQPSSMTTDINDTALAILNSVLFK